MKIEFVPFKAEHIISIEKRPEDDDHEILIMNSRISLIVSNPSMTMLVDGIVKACGGCIYMWPNAAEFWAITSPDIGKYKKVFNEFVLNLIDDVTRALSLTRLQATVRGDFIDGHRWINYLGFKFECVMPKYFDDKTYWLYSKIVEG